MTEDISANLTFGNMAEDTSTNLTFGNVVETHGGEGAEGLQHPTYALLSPSTHFHPHQFLEAHHLSVRGPVFGARLPHDALFTVGERWGD